MFPAFIISLPPFFYSLSSSFPSLFFPLWSLSPPVPAVWYAQALEVSVGKINHLEAMNGSTVLLPCIYSSCIGIKNLYFSWSYNDNGTMVKVRAGHASPLPISQSQSTSCLYPMLMSLILVGWKSCNHHDQTS